MIFYHAYVSLSIPFSFHMHIPIYLFFYKLFQVYEHKDHKILLLDFNFERTSYISETDLEEDIDESNLLSEMLRLLIMEDKQILPHQEITELINLGTDDEKKEVKIGSSLDSSAKEEITALLREYADIFA